MHSLWFVSSLKRTHLLQCFYNIFLLNNKFYLHICGCIPLSHLMLNFTYYYTYTWITEFIINTYNIVTSVVFVVANVIIIVLLRGQALYRIGISLLHVKYEVCKFLIEPVIHLQLLAANTQICILILDRFFMQLKLLF